MWIFEGFVMYLCCPGLGTKKKKTGKIFALINKWNEVDLTWFFSLLIFSPNSGFLGEWKWHFLAQNQGGFLALHFSTNWRISALFLATENKNSWKQAEARGTGCLQLGVVLDLTWQWEKMDFIWVLMNGTSENFAVDIKIFELHCCWRHFIMSTYFFFIYLLTLASDSL